MQALILAAGRGSRLGKTSEDVPKCLLEVGRRPIVEHQLEALAEAGVGPVGMTLGYCADEIKETVGIRAEYILNQRWNVTNSLYSFWLARDWIESSVLILNSDLVFHPQVIERLLSAKGDAIAYDSTSGNAPEHMKVQATRGRLVGMSKEMRADHVAGENVGILCLTKETVGALISEAGKLIEADGEKLWLGSAISGIANERDIRAIDIAPLPWGEIDTAYDLERTRKEIWPAIAQGRGRNRLVPLISAALILFLVLLALPVWTGPESAWATARVEKAGLVEINAGDRTQLWSLLEENRAAELKVHGPTTLRVETRLLMSTKTPAPYVIEVTVDGERVDWYKETAVASKSWQYGGSTVGKRQQTTLEMTPGQHEVQVRLVAADGGQCLIRVRHEDTEIEE